MLWCLESRISGLFSEDVLLCVAGDHLVRAERVCRSHLHVVQRKCYQRTTSP